jgi:hypothetical protein
MKHTLFLGSILFSITTIFAQPKGYWQQKADYKMDVSINMETYQYKGKQKLVYTNNSADTLRKVYYHLFNNAFQPGSEMDMRVQTIFNPDTRFVTVKKDASGNHVAESRIANLKPDEIGYLKISDLKQDGASTQIKEVGTLLEVVLAKPILPGKSTTLTLDFDGQVPVQIRRSGRTNSVGVALSMTQWYPKMAEFDFEGWHTDPYIAREFHGVWGDFDVKITIDKDYIIGGTGYLQNNNEIGFGYEDKAKIVKKDSNSKTLTWHFIAPNVHDFAFAADKEYLHDIVKGPNDVDLHFLYKNDKKYIENWKKLQPWMVSIMEFFNKTVGDYPYKQYSFIQGGDGGMEYAMCTLMLGTGSAEGMLKAAPHELAHSWFQHVLASNESKHPWMDEGFATYIEYLVLNEIPVKKDENLFKKIYVDYYALVESGKEQPLSTHGDRFDINKSYSTASYYKGALFLTQLEYLIGVKNTRNTLKRFYNEFKFKHPTPNDIKRTAEKVSGANLDWYLTDWTETLNTVDYGIKNVEAATDGVQRTGVSLERIGRTPMPMDILVEYKDGTKESFYIPLRMMLFEKENPTPEIKRTVLADWPWANPNYFFEIPKPKSSIKKITIDPSTLMTDVKRDNNVYEVK